MALFPAALSEEEEALQRKYNKLKKKKKALLALKKQSSGAQTSQGGIKRSLSDQPLIDTATATEQAKMLVKSGAISAIKAENKNSGFKRSRTLEGKLKDPEKGPTPSFQPFQRSVSADDDNLEVSKRSQRKSLYESFVSSSDRVRDADKDRDDDRDSGKELDRESFRDIERDVEKRDRGRERDRDRDRERDRERDRGRDRDRDRERDREVPYRRTDSFRAPRKGNTIYVHGVGMTEEMLRESFSHFGTIVNLTMDSPRNCAFVTFETMESADQAIAELNSRRVGTVHLKVMIARKQLMLETATKKSVWGSLESQSGDGSGETIRAIAQWKTVQNSAKGSHRDKRTQVVYSEDYLG